MTTNPDEPALNPLSVTSAFAEMLRLADAAMELCEYEWRQLETGQWEHRCSGLEFTHEEKEDFKLCPWRGLMIRFTEWKEAAP